MFISWWMAKQNVVYPCNGILLSSKRSQWMSRWMNLQVQESETKTVLRYKSDLCPIFMKDFNPQSHVVILVMKRKKFTPTLEFRDGLLGSDKIELHHDWILLRLDREWQGLYRSRKTHRFSVSFYVIPWLWWTSGSKKALDLVAWTVN